MAKLNCIRISGKILGEGIQAPPGGFDLEIMRSRAIFYKSWVSSWLMCSCVAQRVWYNRSVGSKFDNVISPQFTLETKAPLAGIGFGA